MEHVHIGKGRLHSFRKMNSIETKDCHGVLRRMKVKELRRELLKTAAKNRAAGLPEVSPNIEHICMSVAWDW